MLSALLCLFAQSSAGQLVWTIKAEHPLLQTTLDGKRFDSKPNAAEAVKSAHSKLIAQGYFDAHLDTVWIDQRLECTLHEGVKYPNFKILWAGNPNLLRLLKTSQELSATQTPTEAERILAYCENHGFPFAQISFADLRQDSSGYSLKANFNEGPKIVFDSLVIRSNDKVPVSYIASYLSLKKGEDYNELKLEGFDKKIKEIPFLSAVRPTEVIFKNGKADYYIFLKKKKANSFNGILGIRPNEKTGGVFFTGDVEVKLLNALNKGDDFYFNWRRLQVQTQDLQIRAAVPFILKLPLGLEGNLRIYRRDSTFTTLKTSLATNFQLGGGNVLKLQVERNNMAKLGTLNTSAALANVNSTLYGLGMVYSKLDYRINPRRGFATEWNAFAGKRQVDALVEGSEPSSSAMYKFEWQAEWFVPLWKKQCVRFSSLGASYIAPTIFTNEMYRIGGLRTIRGFSEETIFATTYTVASAEYRYLFEENSAVYLFTDAAWYERKGNTDYVNDTPMGYGVGVNFDTKSGIFTFNYAVGSEFNNPIQVRFAKISFGFRNMF